VSVNYTVLASVVDIRTNNPRKDDTFLVDTNVWLWMCYGRASLSLNANLDQISTYPTYVKKALKAGSKLFRSSLSFSELSHLIEKIEHEHYVRMNGKKIHVKEFRHNNNQERENVVSEVVTAWNQVKAIASLVELSLNESTTDAAVLRFKSQMVDGYDLFLLESLSGRGGMHLLSNDSDFCTVPGITLFTANPAVITASRNQGKLISR
jgi:hypothetical protein